VPPSDVIPTTVEDAATQQARTGTQSAPLTPEMINQATRRLTNYIGPIAKVISKKAAAQAVSHRHFCALLAEKITDPADRKRFLRDVGVE